MLLYILTFQRLQQIADTQKRKEKLLPKECVVCSHIRIQWRSLERWIFWAYIVSYTAVERGMQCALTAKNLIMLPTFFI